MDPDSALAEICQEAREHKRPLSIQHLGLLHIAKHHEPPISASQTSVVRAGDVFDNHISSFIRFQRFVQDHLCRGVPNARSSYTPVGVGESLEKAGLGPRIE
jgi:hypothetical protein